MTGTKSIILHVSVNKGSCLNRQPAKHAKRLKNLSLSFRTNHQYASIPQCSPRPNLYRRLPMYRLGVSCYRGGIESTSRLNSPFTLSCINEWLKNEQLNDHGIIIVYLLKTVIKADGKSETEWAVSKMVSVAWICKMVALFYFPPEDKRSVANWGLGKPYHKKMQWWAINWSYLM